MALDYQKLAQDIVERTGGKDNISVVQHCMTRLRFNVNNIDEVNQEGLKALKGVLGVLYQGGQLQVVMGKNLIPTYDEVVKLVGGEKAGAVIEENLDTSAEKKEKESAPKRMLAYVAGTVTPMIPGIIAGGMLKVFLVLLENIIPGFSETTTYALLDILGDVPFYFIPIWVAFGAAKRLGSTPIYAMVIASALIAPDFIALGKAEEAVTMLGLQVPFYTYSSKLLPALLSTYLAYHVERFLNKYVPGILKAIFVGVGTIVITFIPTLFILAPLGNVAGTYVIGALLGVYGFLGPVGLAIICALMPYLIMTGMQSALSPVRVELLANQGYDPITRTCTILHNIAEGGAVLGIALRAKNKKVKAEAFSVAIGCIFAGVSEPAIYGFTLPMKKPLYAVSFGAGLGGAVAALLGAQSYSFGYSTILALPIYEDTMIQMAIAVVVTLVGSMIATMVMGFDESIIENNY